MSEGKQKDDGKQKTRAGGTITTSVSVSKEFSKLISQFNLSPTECFRRGVAVTLYDLGVAMYQSEKNKERSEYMKEFLSNIKEDIDDGKMTEDVEEIKELIEEVKKSKQRINDLAIKWVKNE